MPSRHFLGILFCLIFAAAVRAQDSNDAVRHDYFYAEILQPFFAKDESRGLYVPQRKYSELAAPFSIVKSSGTLRVFTVGGSAAEYATRWKKPVLYASRLLGLKLDDLSTDLAAALGRPVELINCGMPGYDSYREALVFDEVLDYAPDLVLLFSGNTEGLGSPPPHFPLIYKMQSLLRRWQKYKELQDRLQRGRGPTSATREAAFEENIRDMLHRAKIRQVPVVVVGPPLNYRDAPTDSAAPMRDTAFLRGWFAYLRRDDSAAVKHFGAALAASSSRPGPQRALTAFYLARALERQGRLSEAHSRYEDAMAADADAVGRCSPLCQQILRRASAAEGAAYVDLDAAFKRSATPLQPGLERFDDAYHWQSTEDAFVSRQIIDAVLPAGAKRPALPDRSFGRDRSLRTARYAIDLMQNRRQGLSWRAVVFLETVYQRHPLWFESSVRLAQRVNYHPEMPFESKIDANPAMLSWLIGEVLMRDGKASAALRMFDEALRADPSRSDILLSRAIALGLLGQEKDFDQSLDEAAKKGLRDEAAALKAAF